MTNTTTQKMGGTAGVSGDAPLKVVKYELDLSDVATLVTTGGLSTAMTIPANTYLQFLQAEVVTALSLDSSTGGRVDIGDGADDDQFVSNATTFTAGTDFTVITPSGSDGPVYYSAENLNIKLTGDKLAGGTANATGILRLVFLVMDTSRKAAMTT